MAKLSKHVAPQVEDQLSTKLASLLAQHVNDSILPEVQRQADIALARHHDLEQATRNAASSLSGNIGGPLGPIPRSFRIVPEALRCCASLPSPTEVTSVGDIRKSFLMGDDRAPFMNDIIRAFRLVSGAKVYMEIGTFDRGNLAYVSTLLSEDATIIGVDIKDNPEQDEKLRAFLKPTQVYFPIVGDSRLPSTFASVRDVLQDRKLDAVFIDGDHSAHAVLCDFANSEELVHDDSVILFHDSVWEGFRLAKGVADTLSEINTIDPVYLVDGRNPPRRFMRAMWKASLWGVVGIVLAREQRWRSLSALSDPSSAG